MDFSMDFWLFCLCFINVLFKVITNLKFCKRCFVTSIVVYLEGDLCAKEIHRLGPMDLKICSYSLEKNPLLWLDRWLNLETFAKIISVTCISGYDSCQVSNALTVFRHGIWRQYLYCVYILKNFMKVIVKAWADDVDPWKSRDPLIALPYEQSPFTYVSRWNV